MTTVFCLMPYLLSVFAYLIPISFFLPFQLRIKEKIFLFLILLTNILLIGFCLGNIGVIILLLSSGCYIAYIHSDRFLNIGILIASYLFCVLWDNLFSLVWDTFISPVSELPASYKNYSIFVLSYLFLLVVICPLIAKPLKRLIDRLRLRLSGQVAVIIFINLLLSLFIFLFNIVIGEHVGYSRNVIMFNCILFACYFMIDSILIVNLINAHMDKMSRQMQQDAYNRLQDYTTQVENMYSSLRSFKHDYFNIMLSMSGYIETGDMDGLKNYFESEIAPLNQKIRSDTSHLNQLINIEMTELKSLVSIKLLYAAELNIDIQVEIPEKIPALPVNTVDLTRIIGIFLDNAIEAALETEHPFLHFAVVSSLGECLFIITNSYVDKGIPFGILMKQNISTKGPNRGIGLPNARKLIAEYDHIFLETEMEHSIFTQRLRISIES